MITVKIRTLNTEPTEWLSQHRTNDPAEAIQRAVRRHFGSRAHWNNDSSISGQTRWYGQVGYPLRYGGQTLDPRVLVDLS